MLALTSSISSAAGEGDNVLDADPHIPYQRATLWFLSGSQDLYGPEAIAKVQSQTREVAERLGQALPVTLRVEPILKDADGIVETMRRANSDPDCVGVIAWMHTFSPAKMWIRGLRELRRPLLHLHTQANESLPWATLDMDFMNLNQAAHGDREFAYILTRLGIPRATVVGHVSHPSVQARVATFARVAVALSESRGLRVVRFGDNMRRVAVTGGDMIRLEDQLGVAVDTYGVNDLVAMVDAAEDAAVNSLVDEYIASYDVAAELLPGGTRAEALRYAARLELGLRAFLTGKQAAAFTTNFEDLGGLRQLPGLAVQRLMADGYGFAAEGDWKTAFLLRALKVMAAGLPGGASFMEDYTYDLSPERPLILGSHMLEVCPSIAAGRPTLEIHPLGIGGREDPVRLRFTAAPGSGVVVGMCDLGNRLRLVANVIELVDPPAPLPLLPVAAAVWEPKPSFEVATEAWLTAGGPHHTVLTTAVGVEALEMLGTLTGIELALIDSATTSRSFARELRQSDSVYSVTATR